MEELEADRAAQKAEKLRLREEQASKTSTTTTEPSSKESNNESVIDQSRDSNRSVEPMDENSSEDPASSSSKLVASSTGDLSVEERRAEAYLKTSTAKTASTTTSTTATGATTTSTSTASSSPSSSESSSESQFNQFLFWRDPPLPLDVDAKSEEKKKEESQEVKGGINIFEQMVLVLCHFSTHSTFSAQQIDPVGQLLAFVDNCLHSHIQTSYFWGFKMDISFKFLSIFSKGHFCHVDVNKMII